MTISNKENQWKLSVQLPSEREETFFSLTKMDTSSFAFKNKDNEFPKLITYKSDNNRLETEISGGDMSIPFNFMKE